MATRAGTAPSAIGYHFGGVAPFRRAVVADFILDMLPPALQTMTAHRTWQDGVAAVVREVVDDSVCARDDLTAGYDDLTGYGSPGPSRRHVLGDLTVASTQDAVVREVVQESLVLARERLTGWLVQQGVAEQHLDGAAFLLVALLDGLLLHHQLDPAVPLGQAADVLAAGGVWLERPPGAASPDRCRGTHPASSAGTTSRSNSSMPLVS